jgi:uncharacterized protein (TIGR02145 family)
MKKILTLLLLAVTTITVNAQTPPEAFNYSAVARDANSNPIANSTIGIQISIKVGSPTGNTVYQENHFVNTDDFGLFNLIVGGGSILSGTIADIDWSLDDYYLQVGMDANGGTNFLNMGSTQLLSVPYALYAKSAGSVSGSTGFSGDYNDLTNTPTNVSAFTNDAGYVTTLNDDDATNELQQLSVSTTGDTLHLQNGGFVIVPGISAANTAAQLATLSTTAASSIADISAVSGGNITNNGGANVTARGVVWGTSQTPSLSNNLGSTSDGTGIGSFTSNLTGLNANTTYYVRAYATNSAGTAYGNELSFTTTGGGSGIVSNPGAGVTFNGYTYSSVVLGNGQEWMAENLRTTSYANGDPIPNVTDGTQWTNLTTGAWANYNNDSQYENPYGKLYNWYTVADPRNVCPLGWHVPTDAEWTALVDYLGGDGEAGGKMKSTGTQYWLSPNYNASNESGFSGLPGGYRNYLGVDGRIGLDGMWWSSTETSSGNAWNRYLQNTSVIVHLGNGIKRSGLSVRCLKD